MTRHRLRFVVLLAIVPSVLACSSGGGDSGDANGPEGAGGASAQGGAGGDSAAELSCTGTAPPSTADFAANGPFATVTETGTGPDGLFTVVRPETLGEDGFVHPIATWGNGITTTPDWYTGLLGALASHGFVVVASVSSTVSSVELTQGLDWLIAQNEAPGAYQGHLAVDCAVTIGYSLGGRAAIESGGRPEVVTTVSFHGLTGAAENLNGPLLLITSTNDGFVTKADHTVPTYERSTVVPTVMATLEVPGAVPDNVGHLIPLNDAGEERAPAMAWLRYWVYGDEGARAYFHGSDCTVCQTPWVDIQRKNGDFE